MFLFLLPPLVATLMLVALRVLYVVAQTLNGRKQVKKAGRGAQDSVAVPLLPRGLKKWRLMAVLGSGGHTSELLSEISGLSRAGLEHIDYVVAETDKLSRTRAEAAEAVAAAAAIAAGGTPCSVRFLTLPRSREVGQSYISSVFTTARATLSAVKLIFANTPDVLLANGPGTCVPLCWAAFALRVLPAFLRTRVASRAPLPASPAAHGSANRTPTVPRVVFIESFARVTVLSLSGKLLWPIVDRFIVQWKQQEDKYPLTEYVGVIC